MIAAQAKITDSPPTLRLSLTLLIGQAFFSGAALAMVYVAGNTLFLVDYGAEFLPYVYIVTGVLASLVFFGLAALQRRWTLAQVISVIFMGEAAIYFLAQLALLSPNARWVSVALMVLFPLGLQLKAISLGSQAGRLFDVRQMKRLFPLVFAGTVVGFVGAALSVPLLVGMLNSTDHLLFLAVAGMIITFAIFVTTVRRFRDQLGQKQSGSTSQPSKTFGQLLRSRFTLKLFSYQMFSAFGTQLVIYIFLAQADARYTNEAELANFFGAFGGIRNIVNLIFMLLFVGPLLSRFGLGLGLAANPITVAVMVGVMAIAAAVSTPVSATLFWLATLTYVLDNFLSDGVTNTSIKTAYQTLAVADRSTVETTVEGIGVPTAIGITGVLLLVLNVIPGLTLTHTIFFTLIVTIVWTAFAFLVYRDYASALLQTLSRRALGEAELALEDCSSLAVVENLLQSSKLNEVMLALDLLERAEHEVLGPSLAALVGHIRAEIRAEALARIARLQIQVARPHVERCLESETNPVAKGAAVLALCALTEAEAVDQVTDEYLDDPEPAIRLGALVGLLRYGGISGIMAAGQRLTFLCDNIDPAERALVARVIGGVGMANFYQPLLSLLADEDIQVRRAALAAAGQVAHARLLPLVINNLAEPVTRSVAMSALTDSGEVILPVVGQALAGDAQYDLETVRRLVRVCGRIKGDAVIALLKRHLNHPHVDVQYQVLSTLNLCGYRASGEDRVQTEQALRGCVKHGVRAMVARQNIGPGEELAPLQAAIAYEFSQARQRLFLLLSFIYEPRAMLRAEERLARGHSADRALAIEALDVTLSGEHKALIIPLVDESMARSQRIQTLSHRFALAGQNRDEQLKEIISDTQTWPDHWTRACAIYAAGQLGFKKLAAVIEGALDIRTPPVRETAAWALHKLATDRYQEHMVEFAADPNPQVAGLVSHLAA